LEESSEGLDLTVLSLRNPFQMEERHEFKVRLPSPPPLPVVAAPPPAPVIHLAERASNLVLNGIVQSAPPQAVMFDRRTQKTHYLSVGDALGEIRILEVSGSRVILGWEAETMELAL
jgi:type II secretory pathway component PulC